jgi:hypothetical protein
MTKWPRERLCHADEFFDDWQWGGSFQSQPVQQRQGLPVVAWHLVGALLGSSNIHRPSNPGFIASHGFLPAPLLQRTWIRARGGLCSLLLSLNYLYCSSLILSANVDPFFRARSVPSLQIAHPDSGLIGLHVMHIVCAVQKPYPDELKLWAHPGSNHHDHVAFIHPYNALR